MSDTPTQTPKAAALASLQAEADEAKAAKAAAKAEAPVEQSSGRRGVYVVYNDEAEPISVYSAEIKAMRHAMTVRGTVKFVEYGELLPIL